MKEKPSFDINSDQFRNENTLPDITTPEDITPEIQSPEEYNKSIRETKTWCSYMERGFRTSRVITGAQSDNHIDTHAGFTEEEINTDKINQNQLMGYLTL